MNVLGGGPHLPVESGLPAPGAPAPLASWPSPVGVPGAALAGIMGPSSLGSPSLLASSRSEADEDSVASLLQEGVQQLQWAGSLDWPHYLPSPSQLPNSESREPPLIPAPSGSWEMEAGGGTLGRL